MKIDHASLAVGAVVGIGLLLGFKYVVFGLHAWNQMLHPGRQEPDSLKPFYKPLLSGALSSGQ